jgi:predicted transposase/invertase (TIGR01784 family)
LEEIHFLELSKIEGFRKDVPITWWLEYLKNPHSPVVEEIGKFEPVIKEAVKMFDVIKSDEKTQELIRLREKGKRDFNSAIKQSWKDGEHKGLVQGHEEGVVEGEHKKATAIAKKLLASGMSYENIAEFTGLSIETVASLEQN